MLCVRCRIPILDGKCPNCGTEVKTSPPQHGGEKSDSPVKSTSVRFEIVSVSPKNRDQSENEVIDWRSELRKKLNEHARKERSEQTVDHPEPMLSDSVDREETQPLVLDSDSLESGPDLNKTAVSQVEEKEQPPYTPIKIVTKEPVGPKFEITSTLGENEDSSGASQSDLPQKDPSDSSSLETADELTKPLRKTKPLQRKLSLDTPVALPFDKVVKKKFRKKTESDSSSEILLSRLLSGIIDLSFPVLISACFVGAASWKLEFDLFGYNSLIWLAGSAAFFFVFNSLFFFLTIGQTPGMILTELKLLPSEGNREITAVEVLFRVVFFILSALSIIGLLWALFDTQKRCLHDILSGSRVIPVDPTP